MRFKTIIISLFAFFMASISSCSRTPDVRIVLCQDMTMKLLNTDRLELEWTNDAKTNIDPYHEAQIVLNYKLGSDSGESICHYQFERAVEVGDVEESVNPLAIYSTYPKQINLKNKIISGKQLTDLVKEVMRMQGKAFINKVEKNAQKVVEKIQN